MDDLAVPWSRNPLAVFGFGLEDVRVLQRRPDLLPDQLRLRRRTLLALHHPDRSGKESERFAAQLNDQLDKAEEFLTNPFYWDAIVEEFLRQPSTGFRDTALANARQRLEQLEAELVASQQQLRRLKEQPQPGRLSQPGTDRRAYETWLTANLPATPLAQRQLGEYGYLPGVLPVILTLTGGVDQLYFLGEDRILRVEQLPKRSTADTFLVDLLHKVTEQTERQAWADHEKKKRQRLRRIDSATFTEQAYEKALEILAARREEVIEKRKRTYLKWLREQTTWPKQERIEKSRSVERFAHLVVDRTIATQVRDLSQLKVDLLVSRFEKVRLYLNGRRSWFAKEKLVPPVVKPKQPFRCKHNTLVVRLETVLAEWRPIGIVQRIIGTIEPSSTADPLRLTKITVSVQQLVESFSVIEPRLVPGRQLVGIEELHTNPDDRSLSVSVLLHPTIDRLMTVDEAVTRAEIRLYPA